MTKKVLSIEIGLQKTKICEVDYGKKNPHVYNCIEFDTPNNTIEDGYIRDKETFAVALKENLAMAKMHIKDVVFTIASTKIANREVIIPLVKENRIQAVVDAGAQEYFPVDVSEYIISYSILESINTVEDKKYKLLLLAAPSNLIKNYYNFADIMHFNIIAIDYIGNSAFQLIKKQVGQGVNLTIQMNEQTTLINVIDNEILTLQRTIPYGTMSVVESVVENKIFEKDTEKEAIALLCQEELINAQLNMQEDEAAAALFVEESEGYNRSRMEGKARQEVTESLRYLVNNVTRVLDYYNSKFPEKRIQSIFLTGAGSKFKGMERLFKNEIGLNIRTIDRLSTVIFNKNVDLEELDQTAYLSVIGAAIAPIGFISKEMMQKETTKSKKNSMTMVLAASVFISIILIGWSSFTLVCAQNDKKEMEAKITALLPVEKVYQENSKILAEYLDVSAFYEQTISPNEKLNTLIGELERRLPSNMVVTSMTVNDNGIGMNILSTDKISVAKMLMEFKQIDNILPSVNTITQEEDENGLRKVTCDVSLYYKDTIKDNLDLSGISDEATVDTEKQTLIEQK